MDELDLFNEQQEILEALKRKKSVSKNLPNRDINIPVFCEDCDGEIPKKRLEVAPFAVRCVVCQAEYERYING